MNNLHNANLIAVAIGATAGILGAATLILYQKITEQEARNEYARNVDKRFEELEAELQFVRSQQKNRRAKALARKRVTSVNSFCTADDAETDMDMLSIADTETVDDEFYDCSDEELGGGDAENGTSGTMMRELGRQLAVLDGKIEDEDLHEEVLCDLRSLAMFHDDDVEVVWRLGRACFKNSVNVNDRTKQERLLQEGIEACERVLSCQHPDLHKWYALLIGSTCEFLPIKEKLETGHRFEKHVKLALGLRPKDPTLHHLIGRFKYTVSGLAWIERKICAALFGEVPSATYEEVLTHLEEAEKLNEKPDLENKYYLGMTYIKMKNYKKGVDFLREACALPTTKESQRTMISEAEAAISQYSSYT